MCPKSSSHDVLALAIVCFVKANFGRITHSYIMLNDCTTYVQFYNEFDCREIHVRLGVFCLGCYGQLLLNVKYNVFFSTMMWMVM